VTSLPDSPISAPDIYPLSIFTGSINPFWAGGALVTAGTGVVGVRDAVLSVAGGLDVDGLPCVGVVVEVITDTGALPVQDENMTAPITRINRILDLIRKLPLGLWLSLP